MISIIGKPGDDPIPNVGRADIVAWFGDIGGEEFDRLRAECQRLDKPMWWIGPPSCIGEPEDFAMFARRDGVTSMVCRGEPGARQMARDFLSRVFRILAKEDKSGSVSAGEDIKRPVDRPVVAHNR